MLPLALVSCHLSPFQPFPSVQVSPEKELRELLPFPPQLSAVRLPPPVTALHGPAVTSVSAHPALVLLPWTLLLRAIRVFRGHCASLLCTSYSHRRPWILITIPTSVQSPKPCILLIWAQTKSSVENSSL